MKRLNKLQNFIFMTGGVLLLVGAATFLTGWGASPYIYIVGSLCFATMQIMASYEGTNVVVRRLRRQQIIGAVLLVLTAVPMMMQTLQMGFAQRNEWVVVLTVAAILELYTSWRIPSELEKEHKGEPV